jgi:hypothetical protein
MKCHDSYKRLMYLLLLLFIFSSVLNTKKINCGDVNYILFTEDACVLSKSLFYKVGRDCFM